MTVTAEKHQVVYVGFALVDCIPWEQMVGDALRMVFVAEDATAISGDEPVDLGRGGKSLLTRLPEQFTIAGEDVANNVGSAGDLIDHRLWQWLAVTGGND